MSETAHPLYWPMHVPRTKYRGRAQFSSKRSGKYEYKTMAEATDALQREMDLLRGSGGVLLSTNVVLTLAGLPRSGQGQPSDPGAALYFTRNKQRICMPCDKWDRVEDNVYAIAKHIEAMRGMERWGVGTTEQAFAGYKALSAGEDWWEVLECRRDAGREVIEAQFKARAKSAHPDAGGSSEAMARLNVARDQAIAELKGVAW